MAAGTLLLTEIMPDPATCPDAAGEWIEVFNAGDAPLSLDGLVIVDEAGTVGTLDRAVVMAPGTFAVLARGRAGEFCDGAAPVAAFYGTAPALNNTGDRVRLGHDGWLLDESPSWRGTEAGVSFQVDDLGQWCTSATRYGGQWGTPGGPNRRCP